MFISVSIVCGNPCMDLGDGSRLDWAKEVTVAEFVGYEKRGEKEVNVNGGALILPRIAPSVSPAY